MEQLKFAANNWSAILQGVAGSAIFWVILLCGQKAVGFASTKFSHLSKRSRRSHLISRMYKYSAFSGDGAGESSFQVATLIFRSLRHLFRGLLWLTLGLLLQVFFSGAGVIGFVGCIYHLFKAYDIVSPFPEELNIKEELAKVEQELGISEKS